MTSNTSNNGRFQATATLGALPVLNLGEGNQRRGPLINSKAPTGARPRNHSSVPAPTNRLVPALKPSQPHTSVTCISRRFTQAQGRPVK
jgi:hypothetical protein